MSRAPTITFRQHILALPPGSRISEDQGNRWVADNLSPRWRQFTRGEQVSCQCVIQNMLTQQTGR
jgi:hypothetical protein